MIYDSRNRDNLNKLADNTKTAAYKWYQYCMNNKIEVLIYETIRTVEQQKKNVAKGASQTMRSYHIVGQALDFVLVDSKGNALWNGYKTSNAQKIIKQAEILGFESGDRWTSFPDSPHLQYNYKGYGTDTFGKMKNPTVKNPDDWTKKVGYNAPKETSKVFRIHTAAYQSKKHAELAQKDLVTNGYLSYAEIFGNDTDGYRLQSGKYQSQKAAETACKKLIENNKTNYCSIIGSKE